MKELTVYSLLRTDSIAHNKSKLSKLLNVTRATIFKYAKDKAGLFHEVRFRDGKYELMANLTR